MAHFVIELDNEEFKTIKGWDQDDAVNEYLRDDVTHEGFYSIRPATVREALVSEYGEDWQKYGPSHVFEVVNNYRTDGRDIIALNHTHANDTFGYDDPVTTANYRVLYDRWSHLEGLSRGPWSNCDVIALELDSEAPSDLTDVLDGLEDYPVIDEESWSEVEQEFIRDHWDSYGRHDVMGAVADVLGDFTRADLTDYAEEVIERLVWEGILDYGCGGGYPSMIDGSACDFGSDEVAKFFADNSGVVTVKTHNGSGEATFDMRGDMILRP